MRDGDGSDYLRPGGTPPSLRNETWWRHHRILEELVAKTNGWMWQQALDAWHRASDPAERRSILRAYSDFQTHLVAACFGAEFVDALPDWVLRLVREAGTMPPAAETLLRASNPARPPDGR